jgi:transposase
LGGLRPASLAPVAVMQDIPTTRPGPIDAPDLSRGSQVEIVLVNGRRLVVPAGVDTEALARILSVVDGQ